MTTLPESIDAIYEETLTNYALDYLERPNDLSLIAYFEYNCNGPIIQEMVRLNGVKNVLASLSQTIKELR